MSAEAVKKIRKELAKIDSFMEQITGAIVAVEELLEGIKQPDTFLAEMNATNQEPEQVGEYEATMIVEAPPSVPDLDDIKPLDELVSRMGLEKESEAALMPDDRFQKLCAYVIAGHPSNLEVSAQWITETLIKQGLAITGDQEKHLEMLRRTRAAFLAKEMDLNQAQGLDGITESEKVALAELAKKNKLK